MLAPSSVSNYISYNFLVYVLFIRYWQERREVKAERKDSVSTPITSLTSPYSNENPILGDDNSPLPSPVNNPLRPAPTMELTDMTNLTGERPPRHYCQV